MQTTLPTLPAEFTKLSPLAAKWGRRTEDERNQIRWNASAADFAELYQGVMPDLDRILALLRNYRQQGMPEDVANLFHLACAFAEASPHHELYGGSKDVPFSFDARRFVPEHGSTAWECS